MIRDTIPRDIEATKYYIEHRILGKTPEEKQEYVESLIDMLHQLEKEAREVITL